MAKMPVSNLKPGGHCKNTFIISALKYFAVVNDLA
jgi:hypothetical protein